LGCFDLSFDKCRRPKEEVRNKKEKRTKGEKRRCLNTKIKNCKIRGMRAFVKTEKKKRKKKDRYFRKGGSEKKRQTAKTSSFTLLLK